MAIVAVTIYRTTRADGLKIHALLEAYTEALSAVGLAAVLVPSTLDSDALHAVYSRADGILLTGGGDIDPTYSGQPGCDLVYGVDEDRDRTELALARWARQDNKPVLGICRGHQILNVAFGGSLIMDIPSTVTDAVSHHSDGSRELREKILHPIEVQADSQLYGILGAGASVGVNSIHHQAIDRLGEGLSVSACAPDGVIEAVEDTSARFMVGVQWHPEMLFQQHPPMYNLFDAFARAVRGA